MMNDAAIRKSIHSRVIRHHHKNENTLVLDELGLHHGLSRIDIAIINGDLHGYEIKSEVDDLARLSSQVESYNSVFGKLTLVVAKKHLKQSTKIISPHWGIIAVEKGPRGGLSLQHVRKATQNKSIEPYAVAKLLWRNEAVELLGELGFSGRKLRDRRSVLYKRLIDSLTLKELQSITCKILKSRKNWRDHEQFL